MFQAAISLLLLSAPLYATSKDELFERDRAAILSMTGSFEVEFRFEETIGFAKGYELEAPYVENATELVVVAEDRGDFIRLQHILVIQKESGGHMIVKHWRQDWRFEDTDVMAFRGFDVWERRQLTPREVSGTWSQAVYQTGDAPRYESIGRWEHLGARSTWESEPTWRPLPRREKARLDYDVIFARNRHTISSRGWVHEQDNSKVVLDDDGTPREVIAHEFGLNTYERLSDELVPGANYWRETQAFWNDVRSVWDEVLGEPGRYEIDSPATMRKLAGLAKDFRKGEWNGGRPALLELIAPTVSPCSRTGSEIRPASSPGR